MGGVSKDSGELDRPDIPTRTVSGGQMAKPRWMGWIVMSATLLAAPARAADVALVAQINGAPTLTRGGATTPLQRGMALAAGDVVETDASAATEVVSIWMR